MSTNWSSRQRELTDTLILDAAIRYSPYLQYLAYGIDLSQEGSAEYRTLVASDLLQRIETEAETVETHRGLGGYGDEFPIGVMCWGGIYFVEASEFERHGFYLSLEDARADALHIAECYAGPDDGDAVSDLPGQIGDEPVRQAPPIYED